MTALPFRQVRDRLNLSSDDDLLSLIARVPQWKDTGAFVDIYSPGMYGHEYRRDGVPLSLDGDSDRYISEEVGPLRLRMWVTREDYRSACHISAPVSPFAYRRVLWGDEETYDYGAEPDSPDTPPHRIRLFAGGAFRVWGVELTDDMVTFRLAPWRWQQPGVMPLYWQVTRPLPEALTDVMTICDSGFNILKRLLARSTSDAKQQHDVNTTAVDQPPAKGNTMPAETDDFFGPRGKPAGRAALACLVVGVTQTHYVAPLCKVYDELKPGGAFRGVIDEWLRALPPEMQNNAARITGIRAGDWTAYDNAPDSEGSILGMIWLCLAYLEGLPEAHAAGKKPARNVRCAYEHIETAHKKQGKCWAAVSNTAVDGWFKTWAKRRSELRKTGESKTILWDK
ncbi:hypothetical protein H5T09_15505 [Escherichia coli]|uniref:hypothetical protein n=2 Tax=Escherichia coli TaxID=562 RepID=UPI001984CAAD|nr:hypothetical protein [Escherichia coli]MBZ8725677.1 hypothetical protein [Escherichia coli]MBZ8730779.1 hypothetical protein [Escherichia coli]MBZ8736523.1 hypothetical protein [Escherichia coli]MBZ8741288.1 hypothetical protein [Escherichia coli]MBZ8746421.1 hypothetical protein [Escherichia coli]